MPKEKSARRGRKTAQGPARRSARLSTRASTRSSTAATPNNTAQFQQPQPDSLPSQSLNDLLDLVRQQVRAEMQAQQAEAGQDESTSGSLTQQAATSTGQPTATTPQPAAGTLFDVSYIFLLVYKYC